MQRCKKKHMTEKLGVTEKEPAFGQKTLDWTDIGGKCKGLQSGLACSYQS